MSSAKLSQETGVESAPTFQCQVVTDFILGVGKADKRSVFVLDIDRVLTGAEATHLLDTVS